MNRSPMYGKTAADIPPEWLAVKKKILEDWEMKPWLVGAGIGEWGVLVYVLDEDSVHLVPTELDGVQITTKVSGPVVLFSEALPSEKKTP